MYGQTTKVFVDNSQGYVNYRVCRTQIILTLCVNKNTRHLNVYCVENSFILANKQFFTISTYSMNKSTSQLSKFLKSMSI